jgi:hypothetical protein
VFLGAGLKIAYDRTFELAPGARVFLVSAIPVAYVPAICVTFFPVGGCSKENRMMEKLDLTGAAFRFSSAGPQEVSDGV